MDYGGYFDCCVRIEVLISVKAHNFSFRLYQQGGLKLGLDREYQMKRMLGLIDLFVWILLFSLIVILFADNFSFLVFFLFLFDDLVLVKIKSH